MKKPLVVVVSQLSFVKEEMSVATPIVKAQTAEVKGVQSPEFMNMNTKAVVCVFTLRRMRKPLVATSQLSSIKEEVSVAPYIVSLSAAEVMYMFATTGVQERDCRSCIVCDKARVR